MKMLLIRLAVNLRVLNRFIWDFNKIYIMDVFIMLFNYKKNYHFRMCVKKIITNVNCSPDIRCIYFKT